MRVTASAACMEPCLEDSVFILPPWFCAAQVSNRVIGVMLQRDEAGAFDLGLELDDLRIQMKEEGMHQAASFFRVMQVGGRVRICMCLLLSCLDEAMVCQQAQGEDMQHAASFFWGLCRWVGGWVRII